MRTRATDFRIPQDVTDNDAAVVSHLIERRKGTEFFEYRRRRNVSGPGPSFSREEFWHALVACLMTSQQRSTRGSPVDRLFKTEPFPLALEVCDRQATPQQFILETLRKFGGIRFGPTIAARAAENLKRLCNGSWTQVEEWFQKLDRQRCRQSEPGDKVLEREAARWADSAFVGLGPKQSRNLWQELGLTRYETPIDGRVMDWIETNLSFKVQKKRIGSLPYYEAVLDHLQAVCEKAGVLPQDLDAAAFDYENRGSADGPARTTTQPGFINMNDQITIRNTGSEGTDHNQYIYQLACSLCGYVYGANGRDIHERKCPRCQDGLPGLPL